MKTRLAKSIQFNSFGDSSVLQIKKTVIPEIKDHMTGMLLVKVSCASVNPIDSKIRSGSSFVSKNLSLPSGIGYDITGQVIKTSSDITDIKPGQIIIGMLKLDSPGSYAEYCLIERDRTIIKPSTISSNISAALPIAGLTAWQALHTLKCTPCLDSNFTF